MLLSAYGAFVVIWVGLPERVPYNSAFGEQLQFRALLSRGL